MRDPTSAPTPHLQRNGSGAGGGGQTAGQLGSGASGTGSMGPSPHMMRKGGSLLISLIIVDTRVVCC